MQRRLMQFVESPTRETYLAVREAALAETPLPIAATDLASLADLLEAEAHDELLARIDALPASKVLSPRVHYLAAEAAEALGDLETVELERFLFVVCLRGLLATGDGTRHATYSVCHATDEHDLLETSGLAAARQQVVEHDGALCDVVTCTDGREVWFDVSAVLSRPLLSDSARKPARKSARNSAARKPAARAAKAAATTSGKVSTRQALSRTATQTTRSAARRRVPSSG
jgi:hypothetical protein